MMSLTLTMLTSNLTDNEFFRMLAKISSSTSPVGIGAPCTGATGATGAPLGITAFGTTLPLRSLGIGGNVFVPPGERGRGVGVSSAMTPRLPIVPEVTPLAIVAESSAGAVAEAAVSVVEVAGRFSVAGSVCWATTLKNDDEPLGVAARPSPERFARVTVPFVVPLVDALSSSWRIECLSPFSLSLPPRMIDMIDGFLANDLERRIVLASLAESDELPFCGCRPLVVLDPTPMPDIEFEIDIDVADVTGCTLDISMLGR
jgi:hypothetical protein